MAGLLDPQIDPLSLGLLNAGSALMMPGRRGRAMAPMAFAHGLLQGQESQRKMAQEDRRERWAQEEMGIRREAADRAREKFGYEIENMRRQDADAQALIERRRRFGEAMAAAGGKWSPELTRLALDAGLKGEDIERMAKGANLGREKLTFQGGVGREPFSGTPVIEAGDVNDPFVPKINPDGTVSAVPNKPVQDFQVTRARAGASNTNVVPRIEVKMGDSVANQVGPMLRDSAIATGGAVKMADSASRILDAVESGNVIAGPTATTRLRIAQLASMLGIGGKDAVAQTRQVIRGLAEASIEARKELQGQGQVTENEAKAVQKALSGDIDDLTVDEIRDIAKLNLRHAAIRAAQHQRHMESMPESLAPAKRFYEVQGMDKVLAIPPERYAIRPPAGANVAQDGKSASGRIGQPSVNDLLKKYGGK